MNKRLKHTTHTHTKCVSVSHHSLGCSEGRLKVLPTVAGAQGAVVKGIWKEVVHQGAEGHAVAPAGREVLNVHMLGWGGGGGKKGVMEEGKNKLK